MATKYCALRGLRVAGPLTSTHLNEDVLLYLFRMLTDKGLLRLMSSCRYLFYAGLPALLARPHGHFYGRGMLRSFYEFLSCFAPASFLSLRQLSFSCSTLGELNIVADILKQATNLYVLEIGSSTFDRCEAIATAMSSLSKLRDFHILLEDSDMAYSILERLQAPLTRLRLEVDDNGKPPLPLLLNFRHTLEDVHLQYTPIEAIPFSCSKVTRLFLWFCEALLPALMPAFPNLEVLSINSGHYSLPRGVPEYEELRKRNVAFQKHKRWPSLVSLALDEVTIYTMSLQDEVDSVVLSSSFQFSDDVDLKWLQLPLLSLRPRHLHLSCYRNTSGLAKALSLGTERLDRLDLRIDIRGRLRYKIMASSLPGRSAVLANNTLYFSS